MIITQGNDSNSYVTIEEATLYFKMFTCFYNKWDNINDKERWLLFSAKCIDRIPLIGSKYNYEQFMEFPRCIFGKIIKTSQAVKDAQCEMLIYLNNIKNNIELPNIYIERIVSGGSVECVLLLLGYWVDKNIVYE